MQYRLLIRRSLSCALAALGIALFGCASSISPVATEVKASDCSSLTTCGECITNVACGWCGQSCMAASSPEARETAPQACAAGWTWKLGTCPDAAAPGASSSAAPAATGQ